MTKMYHSSRSHRGMGAIALVRVKKYGSKCGADNPFRTLFIQGFCCHVTDWEIVLEFSRYWHIIGFSRPYTTGPSGIAVKVAYAWVEYCGPQAALTSLIHLHGKLMGDPRQYNQLQDIEVEFSERQLNGKCPGCYFHEDIFERPEVSCCPLTSI